MMINVAEVEVENYEEVIGNLDYTTGVEAGQNAGSWTHTKQEAQLMLTTGSTRLAVSRGQQTWYHSTCYI